MCAPTPLNRPGRGQCRTCRVRGRGPHAATPRSSRPCLFACRPAWWKPDAPASAALASGGWEGWGGRGRGGPEREHEQEGGGVCMLTDRRQRARRPPRPWPTAFQMLARFFWHVPQQCMDANAHAPRPRPQAASPALSPSTHMPGPSQCGAALPRDARFAASLFFYASDCFCRR